MTTEEAIQAIETAIAEVEWEYPMGYAVALEMAIAALRSQQDAESNEPLTLDELREMGGEPVWWWNTSAKPVCTICVLNRFVEEPTFANFDFTSEDALTLTKYKWLKKCGYKPYRRNPKEE